MASYHLTLVSPDSLDNRLELVRAELHARGFKLLSERNLNPGFMPGSGDPAGAAYTFIFTASLGADGPKTLSEHFSSTLQLDAVIQATLDAQKPKKLACFDMDSTLIQHEVMDELAYRYGIGEKIAAITESAMRGEISFKESFDRRLACLEGFDAALIPQIAQSLRLTPGAEILIKTLKANGTRVAILSGGFENFAVHLQSSLGPLDAIHANVLEVIDGRLSGRISNELVNETRKLALIRELSADAGIDAAQTIAVGDGANDIPMLLYAGLGVAYHAKPIVQKKAPICINHNGLEAILYLLGFERAQFITV